MAKTKLMNMVVALAIVAIAVSGVYWAFFKDQVDSPTASIQQQPVVVTPAGAQSAGCSQNPAYTYSGVDKFAFTAVGGTDYIKAGNNKPVTSLASPTVGTDLTYWKSNNTYFCDVVSAGKTQCGSQQVQADCYQNGTVTVTLFDEDNDVFLTNGNPYTTNVTIAANAQANLELKYKGTNKYSNYPFGGCVAVETPSTITGVSMTGALASAKPCPYVWTYTVQATTNTYRLYEIPFGFDADATGTNKASALQLTSGASDPSGKIYVTFQSANYYVTDKGEIVLGIEKDKNSDTTKVGFSTQLSSGIA